jgi:hypothetical protein
LACPLPHSTGWVVPSSPRPKRDPSEGLQRPGLTWGLDPVGTNGTRGRFSGASPVRGDDELAQYHSDSRSARITSGSGGDGPCRQ